MTQTDTVLKRNGSTISMEPNMKTTAVASIALGLGFLQKKLCHFNSGRISLSNISLAMIR